MIRLVWDTKDESHGTGTTLGVGLDENTALVIYNVGQRNERTEVLSFLAKLS